jgi:hypothetical protein
LAAISLSSISGHAARAADADRTAARYLKQRLGAGAADYVRRVAARLAAAGEIEKARAWTAIGSALTEQPTPEPEPRQPEADGADDRDAAAPAAARRRKAAQCRRLAGTIDRLNDPARSALLRLAEELESEAAGTDVEGEEATEPGAATGTAGRPYRVQQ